MRIKKEIVFLEKKHLTLAEEFAKMRSADTELYKYRGGFKEVDIICGALGEMAVYKLLKMRGIKTDKPDFTKHGRGQKSFKQDLTSDRNLKFHIKSQTLESAELYGHSYLMQRTDPILVNPEPNHFLVPTLVDIENLKVEIYGTIPIQKIVERNMIGECKVEWLRKTKVAIYMDDLKDLNSKIRWEVL